MTPENQLKVLHGGDVPSWIRDLYSKGISLERRC